MLPKDLHYAVRALIALKEDEEMTEEEYRNAKGINKSTLWEIRKSPAHYKWLLNHPQKDTPAFRLGRAVHSAILTPKPFSMDFAELPDWDIKKKAGKEARDQFMAELPNGVTPISRDEMLTVYNMRKAFKASKEAKELIKRSRREKPLFWTDQETGLLCKCRVDSVTSSAAVDIKTTADGSTRAFQRDAIKYGYHVQAAHYLAGIEAVLGWRPDWFFITIEKAEPFSVHIFKASADFIEYGAYERAKLMAAVKDCTDSGVWPGYQQEELHAPSWAFTEDE